MHERIARIEAPEKEGAPERPPSWYFTCVLPASYAGGAGGLGAPSVSGQQLNGPVYDAITGKVKPRSAVASHSSNT